MRNMSAPASIWCASALSKARLMASCFRIPALHLLEHLMERGFSRTEQYDSHAQGHDPLERFLDEVESLLLVQAADDADKRDVRSVFEPLRHHERPLAIRLAREVGGCVVRGGKVFVRRRVPHVHVDAVEDPHQVARSPAQHAFHAATELLIRADFFRVPLAHRIQLVTVDEPGLEEADLVVVFQRARCESAPSRSP